MSKIKQLPESVISKIAAGEVIERPAYVVKELIENSIDADADYIRIDITKAGLQKIQITDNGEGMSREDLQNAIKRHTTSKISHEDDLMKVKTMGFRGEGLASIGAISYMTIKSRIEGEKAGSCIEIEGGKVRDISPCGIPVGTTVIVENIFYNVPARHKFLKSPVTEFKNILQIVINTALVFPNIRFFLTHNKKTILDLPKVSGHSGNPPVGGASRIMNSSGFWTSQNDLNSFSERVKILLGDATFSHLIPVSFQNSYIKLNGFVAKPQLSSTNPTKHHIFVNQRNVKNKIVASAVKDAFGTLLPPDAYPIFVLFVQLPHEFVDVNVHPRKEEVNFHDSQFIVEAVTTAIAKTLAEHNLTFHDARWKKYEKTLERNSMVRDGSTNTYAAEILRDEVLPWAQNNAGKIKKTVDITQLHDLYIVTETDKGIVVIDQHAAHERILYEQFIEAFKKQKTISPQYELKKAIMIDLSISDAELVRANIQTFIDFGFDIEEFAGNTFKICAVPELFKDRDVPEIILEMITDLSENKHVKDIDKRSHRMLTYLACRSAIKAGDKLSKDECKTLLQDLAKCKNPFTCPHGRPVQIEMNLGELGKMFKRS